MKKQILFKTLLEHFGQLNWWPGETFYEIFVGCILAQNTRWERVVPVIAEMKRLDILAPQNYLALSIEELESVIKESGTYRRKAEYLRTAGEFMVSKGWDGTPSSVTTATEELRCELLALKGIGPETCDCILLYVLERPVFVVDAYTKRILSRHKLCSAKAKYSEVQKLFHKGVKADVSVYKEYHGLIVECAKQFCKTKPLCQLCPVNEGELVL